jgi:hypothetical protein
VGHPIQYALCLDIFGGIKPEKDEKWRYSGNGIKVNRGNAVGSTGEIEKQEQLYRRNCKIYFPFMWPLFLKSGEQNISIDNYSA